MAQSQRARGGSRRRNLQRRRARASLLEAARELARERGYRRLRAAEIARRAGLSRETFYTHFPDKQACLAEACDPVLGEIDSTLRMKAAQGDLWAERLLRGVGETLADVYLAEDDPRARAMYAVLQLAAERGLENVALKDLLREAQINKSELTRSFGSIEACFRQALARTVDQLERWARAGECSAERNSVSAQQGRGRVLDPDPRRRLEALLRLLATHPAEARLIALEAPKLSPVEGDEATRGGARALEELIERLLFVDRPLPPAPEVLSLVAGGVAQVIRADVAAGELKVLAGRMEGLEALLAVGLDAQEDARPVAEQGSSRLAA